jgi:hypothetical protein
MMKKSFLIALLLFTTTSIKADDDFDDAPWETSFDDVFIGQINSEDLLRCTITPADVLDVLTNPSDNILIQDVLEQDFYLRTNPVTVRPLHDLPTLHPLRLDLCKSNDRFAITFFFQQMRKAFLSPCSPFISSYLNIGTPDLAIEFDRIAEALGLDFSICSIFPLFTFIKLEERRIGGMFTFQRREECWEWRIQWPLYYIEHNFFLTEREREAIENDPAIQAIQNCFGGGGCPQDTEAFLRQHLVNDIIGLGDIYAQFLVDVVNRDCFDAQLGFEITLPAAIEFKRGLVGRGFCDCPSQPGFDWYQLFCLAQDDQEAAQAEAVNFFSGALDRLTEVAAHTRLGEEHFAFGLLAETFWRIDECMAWHNELRVRYVFPALENRFFRNVRTPAEFNRDWTNPNDVTENLDFLDLQTILFLYPPVVKTWVRPGSIVEFSSALEYQDNCLHVHAGYDIWHQSREFLRLACPFSSLVPLDLQKGRRSAATQQKVFGRVMWDFTACHFDWHIGLFGDATLGTLFEYQSTKGIGEDWTLGIDISMFF